MTRRYVLRVDSGYAHELRGFGYRTGESITAWTGGLYLTLDDARRAADRVGPVSARRWSGAESVVWTAHERAYKEGTRAIERETFTTFYRAGDDVLYTRTRIDRDDDARHGDKS